MHTNRLRLRILFHIKCQYDLAITSATIGMPKIMQSVWDVLLVARLQQSVNWAAAVVGRTPLNVLGMGLGQNLEHALDVFRTKG